MEKLNIYEKIQKAKVELSKLDLKKTGTNQSMKYFELGDFLPQLNEILLDLKLHSAICFGSDMAILTIINIENPTEQTTYTSPMAEAKLRNCHDVQNLGAAQTFLRRYLYMNAFDIVEGDILDATLDVGKKPAPKKPYKKPIPPKPVEPKPAPAKISEEQVTKAYTIATKNGKDAAMVKTWLMAKWKLTSMKDVTVDKYDELCKALEKPIKGVK